MQRLTNPSYWLVGVTAAIVAGAYSWLSGSAILVDETGGVQSVVVTNGHEPDQPLHKLWGGYFYAIPDIEGTLQVTGCGESAPRSATYFEAHPDEARQIANGCKDGSIRSDECAAADIAVQTIEGRERTKRFLGGNLFRPDHLSSRSTNSSVAGLRRSATISTPNIARAPPMPMRTSK